MTDLEEFSLDAIAMANCAAMRKCKHRRGTWCIDYELMEYFYSNFMLMGTGEVQHYGNEDATMPF